MTARQPRSTGHPGLRALFEAMEVFALHATRAVHWPRRRRWLARNCREGHAVWRVSCAADASVCSESRPWSAVVVLAPLPDRFGAHGILEEGRSLLLRDETFAHRSCA
jgi:hypothetical protein